MGDLSNFQREQIVSGRLAGAYVTKMATLLGVSRAAVSKVMTAYTNRGKTSLAKRNSGRKPKLSGRDCHTLKRIVSKNQRTPAKMTADLSTHLENLFPTKTVGRELHKSNIHGRAAIFKLLIIEINA
jgi:transposase